MKPLIQKLVETQGPSGYETQIRSVVRAEVEPYADELQVDALGNLIVRKGKGGADGIKIMLAAHIDEIGVMVTQVDANGFRPLYHPGWSKTVHLCRWAGAVSERCARCDQHGAAGRYEQNAHLRAAVYRSGLFEQQETPVRVGTWPHLTVHSSTWVGDWWRNHWTTGSEPRC